MTSPTLRYMATGTPQTSLQGVCTWVFRLSLHSQWWWKQLIIAFAITRSKRQKEACLLWATFFLCPSWAVLGEKSLHTRGQNKIRISRSFTLWESQNKEHHTIFVTHVAKSVLERVISEDYFFSFSGTGPSSMLVIRSSFTWIAQYFNMSTTWYISCNSFY